jgi:hypothetical protein
MSQHTMKHITGDDETERTWVVTYEYTPYRAATRLDPAEGDVYEFLSATWNGVTLDADDWAAVHGVNWDAVEQEAREQHGNEDDRAREQDERDNGPRDEAWMSARGMDL